MPTSKPASSAKNESGEFDRFTSFMRRLLAVPYSEIKAKPDAEKAAKMPKPKRASASPASSDKG
jgi:hypothetical protein